MVGWGPAPLATKSVVRMVTPSLPTASGTLNEESDWVNRGAAEASASTAVNRMILMPLVCPDAEPGVKKPCSVFKLLQDSA